MPTSDAPLTRITRGQIYRDVYDKRVASPDRATRAADLVSATIRDGHLTFSSPAARDRAMTDGVFLLQIPDGLDLSSADRFAREFHRVPCSSDPGVVSYRNITSERFGDPLLGFHERSDQIEQFLLESGYWDGVYPSDVAASGHQMKDLTRPILASALEYAQVPSRFWRTATGRCSEGRGSYHLTFNHYRPFETGTGLSSHKDDGFVTILRTSEPGLEVNIGTTWEAAPTSSAHFVVNFGLSIELLTKQARRPVPAIMHRVTRQGEDRTSYALFSSSACSVDDDAGIFAYRDGAGLERICDSRSLIFENDHEIYEGTELR